MTKLAVAAPIALSLALLAAPAQAQQGQQDQATTGQAAGGQQPAGTGERTLPHVRGRILATKLVRIPGVENKSHLAALVQTAGGRTMVVDLGLAGRVDVKAGQPITVVGIPGRIGNRLVMFAKMYAVGSGDQVQVERIPTPLTADWRPESRQVKGKVVGTRQAKVRGADTANTLALIETEGGQRLLVDLGTAGSVKTDLKPGTEIAVRGREARIGDRIILLGSQLRAGGETYDLNRPARTMGG